MLRFSAFSVTEKQSIFEAVAVSIVRSESEIYTWILVLLLLVLSVVRLFRFCDGLIYQSVCYCFEGYWALLLMITFDVSWVERKKKNGTERV